MTCELKRQIRSFLIVLVVLLYSFQFCCSVSLARREDDSTTQRGESASAGEEKPEHGQQAQPQPHAVKQVTWTASRDLSHLSGLLKPQPDFKPPANPLPLVRAPKPDQTSYSFALNSSTWTTGDIKEERRPSAPEDGYQEDFTGQGKVLGLLSDSSPHFTEWEAMKPLVECADDVMTLTASSRGFTHLQVDRRKAQCMLLKASWAYLEMTVPYDGCYIIQEDNLQLQLILDDVHYVLSCPVIPQFPHAPSLPDYPHLSPGDTLPPYFLDPVSPTSPPSHQASVKEQTIENPHYQHYLASGFQYQQLPQIFPPALQTRHPPKPTIGRFPESVQQYHQYPSGSEKLSYSSDSHLQYFPDLIHSKDHSEHQVFELPDHLSQYPYTVFYPYVPFYYQTLIPAVEEHPKPSAGPYYPEYYHQKLDYPVSTVTQAPASTPTPRPSFSPKHPLNPQHQTSLYYPPMSYYHQQALSYSASHPASAPPVGTPDSLRYPSSQSNIQTPFHFQLPPHLPPVKQEPEKPVASHHMFYQAHYPKLHPLFPHYPKIPSPTTAPHWITPQTSHIQCLNENMAAFLPFADPESIQVRGQYLCKHNTLFQRRVWLPVAPFPPA
ncbi:hypothetical protein XENOCAPTIV_029813 [Xenoophorus captivus]|uniref:Uncharacterized protein n=1 Tax=Xenoophorus captivus TaxID=1517983 RepID=A0ABV0QPY0_9TELE